MRVLIAGCDTFRSGAVEQLRTHKSRLAALHPPDREGGPSKVMLYERGYGKDAAGIALEAINFGEEEWEGCEKGGKVEDRKKPLFIVLLLSLF